MYLSHRSEPIRQRRRAAGYVGQPPDHATELESTVEAISEGAEVPPKVFFSGGMAGAMQSLLDVPQHRVGPGELRGLHAARATTGFDAPVRANLHNRPEAVQTIRGHFDIRGKVDTRPAGNRVAAKALDRCHAHRQRPCSTRCIRGPFVWRPGRIRSRTPGTGWSGGSEPRL